MFKIRRIEAVTFEVEGHPITLHVRRLSADALLAVQAAISQCEAEENPTGALLTMVDLLCNVVDSVEGIEEPLPATDVERRRYFLDAGVVFVNAAVVAYAPKLQEALGNG